MKEISIENLDKNMIIDSTVNEPDIRFYDVRKDPFEIYGLYNPKNEADFKRIPDDVAEAVSEGVKVRSYSTSGGRVRFCTDSNYVAIRTIMPHVEHISKCAMSGTSSFDMFIDGPESNVSRFYSVFLIPRDAKGGYESILKFKTRRLRYITINFPTYSFVRDLYIGLQQDATVGCGLKYRNTPPVVFYGSSITQGACASRPGNTYESIISRRMNLDFINLGFGGNGKAENAIVEYMAGLKMSAFVADYDHNAPNAQYLKETHLNMYEKIRSAHPDLPYIMISRVDFDYDYEGSVARRRAIFDVYSSAKDKGDKNIYFIDGDGVFRGPYQDLCTIERVHPTDIGFALMADAIGRELERALTRNMQNN